MTQPVIETPTTARSTITSSVLPLLPQPLRTAVRTVSKKAPFSHTLRRIIGAYCGKHSYHARVLFFLVPQHQLAYLQIPKVACTSIKTTLYRLNYPEAAEDTLAGKLNIHSNPEWKDKLTP